MRIYPLTTRSAGFTLIEVLVALAILAVALGALIQGGTNVAVNTGYLRDKTFAEWVALNQIAERQIAPEWPAPGRYQGVSHMAGQEWHWEEQVETTEDADMRRLVLQVSHAAGDGPVVSLVAYLPNRAVARR